MDSNDATAVYYVNYAEAAFSPHEFCLSAARVPTKLPQGRMEEVQRSGAMIVSADVQLVFPPTLIPGLIRALNTIKDAYEKATGITIREAGADSEPR
jgi:hypothetical protein